MKKVIGTDMKNSGWHCECRPICKNRRRLWKGQVQKTSAELLLESQQRNEDLKDSKTHRNRPCELWLKPHDTTPSDAESVEICDNPIADSAFTPCLEFVELAKRLGAWDCVKAKCAFCHCRGCCQCAKGTYQLKLEGAEERRQSMREFDHRIKNDCRLMRIMYNKI